MRRKILAVPCSLLALTTACGRSSSGPSAPEQPPGPIRPPTVAVTPTPTPTPPPPTPTPTPSGPVYLESFFPNGTNVVPMGKCLGFTVVGNGVTFAPDTKVKATKLGTLASTVIDATHLRVGAPETKGTCVYTPIFGKPGPRDVTISSGADSWTLTSALQMAPSEVFATGEVSSSMLFTRDLVSSAGANTFETPYDVDIYKVDTNGFVRVYTHVDFFDQSGASEVPLIEFWNTGWPNGPLNKGAISDVFPENGPDYFVVRDVLGKGGPGADYDLGATADQLQDPGDVGTGCGNVPRMRPGTYHIGTIHLWNGFDPDGSSGCADSIFGTPISAPGFDSTWIVTVPAGKTLRAMAYDNHYDQAVYLLPKSPCSPHPTNCIAAAGYFGGGDVNTIKYTNHSDTDEDFRLVFDTWGVNGNPDTAFFVKVEILDRE